MLGAGVLVRDVVGRGEKLEEGPLRWGACDAGGLVSLTRVVVGRGENWGLPPLCLWWAWDVAEPSECVRG